MGARYSMYFAVLKLLDDASRDLGLTRLTPSNRTVLLSCIRKSESVSGAEFVMTYDDYLTFAAADDLALSKAQFYNSLNALVEAGALVKNQISRKNNLYSLNPA